MADDASLDEFIDAGESEDEERESEEVEGASEAGEDADVSDEAPAPEAADAGLSTYDWSPEGAACAACGTVVERRWRDDPGLVCESCKEW